VTVKDLEVEVEVEVGKLTQRVSHLEGRLAPPNTWVRAALLGFVGTALAGYFGWLGFQTVKHGEAIAAMQMLLSPQQLVQLSTDATDPKAIQQATAILSETKFQKVPLDNRVVDTAGRNFILASEKNVSAWPVATMLVNYRSSLNAAQEPKTGSVLISKITSQVRHSTCCESNRKQSAWSFSHSSQWRYAHPGLLETAASLLSRVRLALVACLPS
jgi:hypothetical protein